MDGTEDFLALDQKVKNCTDKETVRECKAREFLDIGREECHCVPHYLINHKRSVS